MMRKHWLLWIIMIGFVSGAWAAEPIASFTANPRTGAAPLTVVLDGGASSGGDGVVVQYEWYIDNVLLSLGTDTPGFEVLEASVGKTEFAGTDYTVTRRILRVYFKQDGKYTVSLRVKNHAGAVSNVTTDTVTIGTCSNHYTLLFGTGGGGFSTALSARAAMQRAYALEAAKQIIAALDDYREAHQAPMPAAELDALVAEVLNYSQDPLIQEIAYVPGQMLNILLHDGILIPGEKGMVFPFKFVPAIEKWVVDMANYPLEALILDPTPENITLVIKLVSFYCHANHRHLIPTSTELEQPLPAAQWCPAWNDFVQPVSNMWVVSDNPSPDEVLATPKPENIGMTLDAVSRYCLEPAQIPASAGEQGAVPAELWCDVWYKHIRPRY